MIGCGVKTGTCDDCDAGGIDVFIRATGTFRRCFWLARIASVGSIMEKFRVC